VPRHVPHVVRLYTSFGPARPLVSQFMENFLACRTTLRSSASVSELTILRGSMPLLCKASICRPNYSQGVGAKPRIFRDQ
jgi:hypothetical protein